MSQAIKTTYRGPTNSSSARIVASSNHDWIYYLYDDALSEDENHVAARTVLINKLKWNHLRFIHGTFKGSYYHVAQSYPFPDKGTGALDANCVCPESKRDSRNCTGPRSL